jgi:iron complex transport system substrate-binding protein
MRICSLLPSATEMVYALGLGDQLVGVSHTCDYPEEARTKPVVSRSLRDVSHLSGAEIDAHIQQARTNHNPLYWIDGDLLEELRPDLILTQEICEVCAVGSGSVFETAARVLDYQPTILIMRPAGLEDIFQNILSVGRAAEVPERGEALVQGLRQRVKRVNGALADVAYRPRVFCIDWLDPLRNTGQWTPELVELAGGREALAIKWGKSREVEWSEVLAYQPEYLMVMPCAFDLGRATQEFHQWLPRQTGWEALPAVQRDQVYLFDGKIPSRHGPRVVDVMEALAEAMYPERFSGLAAPGIFRKAALGNRPIPPPGEPRA